MKREKTIILEDDFAFCEALRKRMSVRQAWRRFARAIIESALLEGDWNFFDDDSLLDIIAGLAELDAERLRQYAKPFKRPKIFTGKRRARVPVRIIWQDGTVFTYPSIAQASICMMVNEKTVLRNIGHELRTPRGRVKVEAL